MSPPETKQLTRPDSAGLDPATATIIAALMISSTTIATSLATALGGGVSIGGVMSNSSRVGLTLWKQSQPSAGNWEVQPSAEIEKMPSAQILFEAWKESGTAPPAAMIVKNVNDLSEALLVLWKDWLEQLFLRNATIGEFGLKGGFLVGCDSVAVYTNPANSIGVAFYLFKPATAEGIPEAGCMIADRGTMAPYVDNRNDPKFRRLIDHIRTTKSDHTRLSIGGSETVSLYDLRIRFAAGNITRFDLEEND